MPTSRGAPSFSGGHSCAALLSSKKAVASVLRRPSLLVSRRGFALPVALGFAIFVVAVSLVMVGYLRHSLAGPARARFQARAAASLAVDMALDKLAAVAADDRVATAPAGLISSGEPLWTAAYAAGSTSPTWLVSGDSPSPGFGGDITFSTGATAPSVETPFGKVSYYVDDLSQRVAVNKADRFASLDASWGDDVSLLRHQTLAAPNTTSLASSISAPQSWGVLSNPTDGGLKTDLDSCADTVLDGLPARIRRWRDPDEYVRGRPLVWAEVGLLMGIYGDTTGYPSLGLAFWADAWNPYTLQLPFNAQGTADMQLRISGPAGVVNYYDISKNLLFSQALDLEAHTTTTPVGVDLYGSMAAGEVRFVTHYRKVAIYNSKRSDIGYVQTVFPAGNWSFTFETLDGTAIQTIKDIPFGAFTSARTLYKTTAATAMRQNNSQWLLHFRLKEPVANVLAKVDPRWPTLTYGADVFAVDSSPTDALSASIFPSSQTLSDGATQVVFDIPEGSLASVGALSPFYLQDVPSHALGSLAGSAGNGLFDGAFFSGLANAASDWVPSGIPTVLPNPHLRLWGAPSLAELTADPASHALVAGAFNLNTLSAEAWVRELPDTRYGMLFRESSIALDSAITTAQKAAWATAIVAKLKANGTPWRSVADFAAEDLLPNDVLGQLADVLTVRGDTFLIHAYGESPSGDAHAFAEALVQRLPTPTSDGATTRSFQVLKRSFK